MARTLRVEYAGDIYHVMNRGGHLTDNFSTTFWGITAKLQLLIVPGRPDARVRLG